jgi:hypothetical protein
MHHVYASEETMDHMLVEGTYVREVWGEAMKLTKG